MRRIIMATLTVGALLLTACADEDATGADTSVTSVSDGTQDRDRDRDRDRIHQSIVDVLDACGDQDRDRLRDRLADGAAGQADGLEFRYQAGTSLELVEEEYTFDGDQATVRAQVRVQERNRAETRAEFQLRFRLVDGDWLLEDLPPCLDDGTTPSTVRDQDQDQNQDQDRSRDSTG